MTSSGNPLALVTFWGCHLFILLLIFNYDYARYSHSVQKRGHTVVLRLVVHIEFPMTHSHYAQSITHITIIQPWQGNKNSQKWLRDNKFTKLLSRSVTIAIICVTHSRVAVRRMEATVINIKLNRNYKLKLSRKYHRPMTEKKHA